MKPVSVAVLAVCLLLLLPFTSGAARRIKLGTLAPEGSPWHKVLRDMAEDWKTASAGRVRVRIYAGGIAGDEQDMVRKMKIGQLHAAALTGEGLSRISTEVQALQMPMMFKSQAELDFVRKRIGPKIEAGLEKKGFKLLTWGDAGWVYFFTQKPVVHPDDLKPLRLFVWAGGTAHIDAWKASGYQPVPLAATEIHTALQSGLINAFTTTPVAALSYQWFGQAKHMTDLKWAPLVGGLVITSRAWGRIGEGDRRRLLRISREAGRRLQALLPKLSEEARRVMVKHGLQIHSVQPKVVKLWEARARAGYPKIVGQLVSPEMIAEVERIRNEYRAGHGN
ncbi:MAG: TRAP transporter substrate-binding protein DctP [bacterium]